MQDKLINYELHGNIRKVRQFRKRSYGKRRNWPTSRIYPSYSILVSKKLKKNKKIKGPRPYLWKIVWLSVFFRAIRSCWARWRANCCKFALFFRIFATFTNVSRTIRLWPFFTQVPALLWPPLVYTTYCCGGETIEDFVFLSWNTMQSNRFRHFQQT